MSSSERKSGSLSERITRAWQGMCESGQIRLYMESSRQEIEDIMVKEKVSGYEYIIGYLQALQEWSKGLR